MLLNIAETRAQKWLSFLLTFLKLELISFKGLF